jgi:chromosome segregation ATPase
MFQKVVTIDGELLHKSGNISGVGSSGPDSRSSTWDHSSAAALKSKKDALIEQLSAVKTDFTVGAEGRMLY